MASPEELPDDLSVKPLINCMIGGGISKVSGSDACAAGVCVEGGADSALSSWPSCCVGDVVLGGLSLRDPPCWGEADREEITLLVLLLLKTCPSSEPSSSEGMTRTPLPLSRGAGVEVLATASGTAAIGGGELGVWRVWGELVVWAVCGEAGLCGGSKGVFSVIGVYEASTFAEVALVRAFKALASARRLDESITKATLGKQKNKGLEPIPVKHEASDAHSYTQKFGADKQHIQQ